MAYGPLRDVHQAGDGRWNLAVVPLYEAASPVLVPAPDALGVVKTSEHPEEAVQVAYAIASSPELMALWGALPARESVQRETLAALSARFPGVDWQVAADSRERARIVAESPAAAWDQVEHYVWKMEEYFPDLAMDVDTFIGWMEDGLEAADQE